MIAAFSLALAYSAPLVSRPALVGRSVGSSMQLGQLSKKTVTFDQDGLFEGREVGYAKPPVKLLQRVEELRVLSAVADAGLLSAAEDAGLFSKLENAGAFSKIEGLLPLLDDLRVLSLAEGLLNLPSSYLFGAGLTILSIESLILLLIPRSTDVMLYAEAASAVVTLPVCGILFATSYLFSLLQGDN